MIVILNNILSSYYMDTEVIEFIKNNDFNNFFKFIEDNKNDQYFYSKIKKII